MKDLARDLLLTAGVFVGLILSAIIVGTWVGIAAAAAGPWLP